MPPPTLFSFFPALLFLNIPISHHCLSLHTRPQQTALQPLSSSFHPILHSIHQPIPPSSPSSPPPPLTLFATLCSPLAHSPNCHRLFISLPGLGFHTSPWHPLHSHHHRRYHQPPPPSKQRTFLSFASIPPALFISSFASHCCAPTIHICPALSINYPFQSYPLSCSSTSRGQQTGVAGVVR
ncbi:hypothetical protein BC939DRAFT_33532 [Gamsiella multidivaricata]|uniref:uncharacterized protein n=1 Tax=Gamsiella multidivaricata TaxID=101098 RepID=UPI00221F43DC|nr:uncharacterized protein BC939DRAFT_33532 [Gamsiella multidivaricata]KAI7816686.1 hypothetical protein BC939DRAFT_33532 [Gamsiella multidivaricata]